MIYMFLSDNVGGYKFVEFALLTYKCSGNNYKLLFAITSQSASNQFTDMSVMLFPRTVPSFEYSL